MPGSPRRIFRNLTDAQLTQLQNAALDRALFGQLESLAGQGHSSTTKFDLSVDDLLFELNYELGVRGLGTPNLPQKVYQVLCE